ncbi:ketopantoate reductase family protein [Novosphingobium humi]|uniref:2-dehydropantoate 2-reductase n=1 Tax=Novosphingobium humi TaxID=2282397 RepID=A0ABY7U2X5_9SPHN|nr:2-dehydropantoate 2-reductase [Novosphingobium humi]WCT79136.1 2-dehydropantoate 2-reductase [Novosphingobium humi]
MMRIAVIGAGAIGSAVAAALVGAGRNVTLVARGSRLTALQLGPLRIESDGQIAERAVKAVGLDTLGAGIDLAIFCVKAPDLATTLHACRPLMAPGSLVLTLQNGVEAQDMAQEILPGTAVLAGRVHGFFEMEGQLLRHVGVVPSIVMGCARGDPVTSETALLSTFAESAMRVSLSPDIRRALWEKFLIAAGLGGLAAALQVPAGLVLSHPGGEALLRMVLAEIVAIAATQGIGFDGDDIERTIAFIRDFPPDATTSLQRDIAAGRPSEYDALTGAALRMARLHGVAHPVLVRIDRAIDVGVVLLA